jgi:hypothetical protein
MKPSAWISGALLLGVLSAAAGPARLPGLVYHPEGDAIVIENGTRWDNRPLYGHERFAILRSGEQPGVTGPMGRLLTLIARGDTRLALHQFQQRSARYRAGRMEWEVSDARLPGLIARLVITTLANADGCTARLIVEGARPGDLAGWALVPPGVEKESQYQARTAEKGFTLDRVPAAKLAQIAGRFSSPVTRWERGGWKNHDVPAGLAPLGAEPLKDCSLIAWVPLADRKPQFAAIASDENDPSFYAAIVRREKPLDPAAIADPAKAFAAGLARVQAYGDQVVVDSPDPYFNAAVSTSTAAAIGLFVDPVFVHGGSSWRNQQPGWRTMGAAYNYGFHEPVKRSIAFWDSLQVKKPKGKPHGVYSENGAQQAGDSRFFGEGFIDYKQPPHYEFQTQFFDEAVRAWRATSDPALERMLLPMLELQLKRCLDCFDPDGDGLYESYNNTWPNDSVWFSGGGTVEQSAYVYYGRRAAADMRRRRGDPKGASAHDAVADHIKAALNKVLWLPGAGHYASYIEQGGHQRVHTDPWIYSQHVPIEAGLSEPMQAWQAMHYTEWAMERFPFPFGGEMRQTSNWVPGQWSIRETYPGDNFGMALGYAMAGLPEDAWSLLGGTFLHSMFGDPKPMRGYGNEMGNYGRPNIVSPGGLSHPNCGIDFNDITSMFGRAVVEGVFGYQPDHPNHRVRIQPALPPAWDHASIRTPDYSFAYRREGAVDAYKVKLQRPAAFQLRVPVFAREVKGVTVNGKPAEFEIRPWYGFGMLFVSAPVSREVAVRIELAGHTAPAKPLVVEARVNDLVALQAGGKVLEVVDPQKTLNDPRISGSSVEARAASTPGHHLVFLKMDGAVPWYQPVKLHLTDPLGEATRAAQSPREAPAGARWQPVDISPAFNGDIRNIYQQDYASPRPDTVSMRIARDGWGAWTFKHWRVATPNPKLDGLDKIAGSDGRIRTPQNVEFLRPADGKNIAFTSLWDNWPREVTVPVDAAGDSVWLLLCGSTNPMQLQIANAVLRFRYTDGKQETLDLVPPRNFWSLTRFGRVDYDYTRDGFVLPKDPPPQVRLGADCRAIVTGWKLRSGVKLASVTLETLSPEVVVGLMGVSIMNPSTPDQDPP